MYISGDSHHVGSDPTGQVSTTIRGVWLMSTTIRGVWLMSSMSGCNNDTWCAVDVNTIHGVWLMPTMSGCNNDTWCVVDVNHDIIVTTTHA